MNGVLSSLAAALSRDAETRSSSERALERALRGKNALKSLFEIGSSATAWRERRAHARVRDGETTMRAESVFGEPVERANADGGEGHAPGRGDAGAEQGDAKRGVRRDRARR